MGNRTLKAGLFAALAAGALWVLPMSAWAAPVFPEGISADGESLAGKTWEDALHTAEEKVKSGRSRKRVKKLCRWKPDPSIYEQKGSGKGTSGCFHQDSSRSG